MNMKYAMRSEDTEQINVVSWADWNRKRYPELKWLFHVPNGGSRNRQQDTQKEFLADMAAAGHFVATCYSAEEAIKVIEEYLSLIDTGEIKAMFLQGEEKAMMPFPNNSILSDGKIK